MGIFLGENKKKLTFKRAYLGNTLKYKSTKQIIIESDGSNSAGAFRYSYDGITWHGNTIPAAFWDICYKDGYFYATSRASVSVLYRSNDMINWVEVTKDSNKKGILPRYFVSNKNGFIGFNTMFADSININYSSNGTTWNYTKSTDSNKLKLYRIYDFNNVIIYTGKGGMFYKTKDEPLSEMIKSCHFTKIDGTEYSSDTSLALSFYRLL